MSAWFSPSSFASASGSTAATSMGNDHITAKPGCLAVRPSQPPSPNIPLTRDQHQSPACLAAPNGGDDALSG